MKALKKWFKILKINLKKRTEKFVNFSVCLDETTDIKDTAQLAIFFRGVISDF